MDEKLNRPSQNVTNFSLCSPCSLFVFFVGGGGGEEGGGVEAGCCTDRTVVTSDLPVVTLGEYQDSVQSRLCSDSKWRLMSWPTLT